MKRPGNVDVTLAEVQPKGCSLSNASEESLIS